MEEKCAVIKLELIKNNHFTTNKNTNNFRYLALGQFDGVNINLLSVSTLPEVIEDFYQKGLEINNDNKYQKQIFYLFQENKEEIEKFLESDNWIFQFVTFIHGECIEDSILKQCKEIKEAVKENNKSVKIECFDTLDNSLAIAIIRTPSYKDGLASIQKIINTSQERKAKHCYSILSINSPTFKNKTAYPIAVENFKGDTAENERTLLYDSGTMNINEKIDVHINFKVKDFVEFKKYKEDNKEAFLNLVNNNPAHISWHPLIGNNDEKLIMRDVHVTAMLPTFFNHGLLDFTKSNNQSVFSTNTYLHVEGKQIIDKGYTQVENTSINDLKTKIISEATSQEGFVLEIYQHIFRIINTLVQIENYGYNNYLLATTYNPLEAFCTDIMLHSSIEYDKANVFINELYDVMNSVISSSLQIHHNPIMKSSLYYAPGKLLAFYSYYMKKITELVVGNTNAYKYTFLFKPTLGDIVDVHLVNSSKEPGDRLLTVHAPVKYLFDLKSTLFTLSHELSHYVGDETREREKRFEYFVRMFFRTIIDVMLVGCEELKEVSEFMIRISKWSKRQRELEIASYKKICEAEGEKVYYCYFIERDFIQRMITYFKKNKVIIVDIFIGYTKKVIEDNEKEVQKYRDQFTKSIEQLVEVREINNITRISYDLFDMFRECYADLFAMRLLKISENEYIENFYISTKMDENKTLDIKATTRIAFVMATLDKNFTDLSTLSERYQNSKKIIQEMIDIITEDTSLESSPIVFAGDFNISLNIKLMKRYLNVCNEKIDEFLAKKDIEEIRKLYKNSGKNVLTSLAQMHKLEYEYSGIT